MIGPEDHDKIPEPVPPLPLPEFDYGKLEKQERIGTGGDANVYRATLEHDGYTYSVAIKEPRFEGTIQKRTIEKFQNEAETWAGLNDHDNIVSVYSWGSEPVPWLALEHMDGGTLETRIGDADLEEALWLSGRIAEGIRYGHRHGIAHLDIKPTNILLRETGPDTWNYPKVSDWGLAKLLLEHSNSVEGISPTYATPEQFDAEEFGSPDDITDIYQLGTVVYALITGEPPFSGSSTAVMRSVLDDEPRPPSEVNSEVPGGVDEIVLKALAKRKKDRYEGVLPFRKALDELFAEAVDIGITSVTAEQSSTEQTGAVGAATAKVDQEPNTGPSEGSVRSNDPTRSSSDKQSTDSTSPLTRRRALGILGLGLGGAGGLWALGGSNDDETPNSDAAIGVNSPTQTARPTATQTATGRADDTATETEEPTSTATNTVSVTGSWPMFQQGRRNQGYVSDQSGPQGPVEQLWRFEAGGKISGSPVLMDGVVYVGSHNSNLYAVDAQTGEQMWKFGTSGRIFRGPAVDQEAVYVGSENADVYSISRQDGQLNWNTRAGPSSDYSVQKHTITQHRLYTSTSGYGRVVAFDPNTGTVAWRFEADGGLSSNISTAPAIEEGMVVFGSNNSYIHALAEDDGSQLWSFDTGQEGLRDGNSNDRVNADPTIAKGVVYSANAEGQIYAIELESGSEQWRTSVPSAVNTSPALVDGRLFVGSNDGILYAIDSQTGDILWEYETPSGAPINSSPVATSQRLYFGSGDNRLYCLSPDGEKQWDFETGGAIGSSPAIVDDTLFIGSHDGNLYALKDEA